MWRVSQRDVHYLHLCSQFEHSGDSTMQILFIQRCSAQTEKAVKFQGVYVDQHLTWNDYISYISKKIAKFVVTLFSISHYEDHFIL